MNLKAAGSTYTIARLDHLQFLVKQVVTVDAQVGRWYISYQHLARANLSAYDLEKCNAKLQMIWNVPETFRQYKLDRYGKHKKATMCTCAHLLANFDSSSISFDKVITKDTVFEKCWE